MESQAVRRRANVIAAHLASHEDIISSAPATHVFPMSCSNSLSSAIRRCDNRMLFARQGSTSQGCYMRQSSSSEQGNKSCSNASEAAPAFSRPAAEVGPAIPGVKGTQDSSYPERSLEAPMFARPNEKSKEMTHNFAAICGIKWSPRMNVVESAFNYVVTLEIPGVSVDNIRVEIHDQRLIVNGNRLNKSESCYHRREIMQGLYRIVWPLPNNANKDNISAEIQDGLLQITIPKLSGLRWLRKANI
ncbi:small heat shock protein c4 [Phtheirospermum japonicum]|uniref:Small heat shock protein c4 n=1 Tax=Phtheirospermum japonicum TaxID=374723 RepID=A0A830BJV9_9LAMI|nr:small heat shock protein c4 [Phtheirospermum japonicum]